MTQPESSTRWKSDGYILELRKVISLRYSLYGEKRGTSLAVIEVLVNPTHNK